MSKMHAKIFKKPTQAYQKSQATNSLQKYVYFRRKHVPEGLPEGPQNDAKIHQKSTFEESEASGLPFLVL